MRFRPGLATSCSKSVPITTPRFGEGGGPDSRICASQALRPWCRPAMPAMSATLPIQSVWQDIDASGPIFSVRLFTYAVYK